MREEKILPERLTVTAANDLERDTAELAEKRNVLFAKRHRHKSRSCLRNVQAKLPRKFVAKIRCSELGDGEAARGDDQRGGFILCCLRADNKPVVLSHVCNTTTSLDLHIGSFTFA